MRHKAGFFYRGNFKKAVQQPSSSFFHKDFNAFVSKCIRTFSFCSTDISSKVHGDLKSTENVKKLQQHLWCGRQRYSPNTFCLVSFIRVNVNDPMWNYCILIYDGGHKPKTCRRNKVALHTTCVAGFHWAEKCPWMFFFFLLPISSLQSRLHTVELAT